MPEMNIMLCQLFLKKKFFKQDYVVGYVKDRSFR